MSFFSNFQSDKCPGSISGNPLSGLTEKICVSAKKVFDACIKQMQRDNVSLTLTNLIPENPTYPLSFISAKSVSAKGAVNNLNVEHITDKPCNARVKCDVAIPMEVLFVDAKGVEGKGFAHLNVPMDVVLFVPQPSIMPFCVEATCSCVAPEGRFEGERVVINCCFSVILKVIMDVDILIPAYGYCQMPPCQEFNQEVCAGFFELPLYPKGNK